MQNKYIYPAIFDFDEDGITVTFPDLPGCITCGDNQEEALKNAKEVLELYMYSLEEDNETIPQPSNILDLEVENTQVIVLVDIWMVPVRDEMKNKCIKKTLTIPKWLNDLAIDNNVNFSAILQSALKEYLGK
ncbi:MAG: type II toxin-antitoxin system HicB family antitoxin [Romboutsia timonensis]|uniref:type II toxin-antitoxin system HicB family antitoxin n=1 Tax=Romboutsia timonensis TaxID=1776391 RepID=UPI002A75DE60|nr:type II toxin-antitoxin system HicB family antitoxin [Romboutsia timonensis]MDY2882373.1 type II toxin-antitoxin system HicB family antitoxin [Romboutsia timonensis]